MPSFEHDTVPAALDALDEAPSAPVPPVWGNEAEGLWAELQKVPRHHAPHLGEALVEAGFLTPAQLRQALRYQDQMAQHVPLGEVLVLQGLLTAAQLRHMLAAWMGVPTVDLGRFQPEAEALALLPPLLADREAALPLMCREDTLVVAVADPWDPRLLEMLRFTTEHRIRPVLPLPGTLAPALARAYRRVPTASAGEAVAPPPGVSSLSELAQELARSNEQGETQADVVSESDNTLVRLINRLIQDAIELRASDIHIETFEPPRPVRVRLRIDGELRRHLELPARVRFAIVARLKVMAELDISEHRRPQDGKLDFARFGHQRMELRMVTVPTSGGLEDVVLRLLGGVKPLPLDGIGLSERNLQALRGVMCKAYGLLLICGPTGCGKTTTLHSVMRELNEDHRKIWTAEDPIEITQEGLRQVQVNARIGWTFAAAMRTFLRADPDIIMIGEMRDEETARIAVEASLTGHLVMSTLHTNSAPESVTRLLEIGLDPFTFSDSLLAVLAQRLVRRLCTDCRVAETLDERGERSLARLYLQGAADADVDGLLTRWRARFGTPLRQYRRQGCAACGGSGYRGRLGIHELVVADDALRELIRRRAPAAEMFAAARQTGMNTLRQDGIEKLLAGLTDLPEVLAATNQ
ncbi:type II secretory ATPase GspE/PulE/Tfp pilus assembly ATPase PilB-like protein [Inhella inkyongensis]|uniref:Type II secretory ATPase GspE/PulE/Tfp pilus assembly ATPase PilB-like protein n=1 Tax=Inhella inkyongensis TaxID=392593 RepID=A0A840S7P3_9BURK|nr:GspE/PulE family protein [Inhella inkyongensis]MBB5204581.1 type II secretory ATPase GspE/PulE/Tfp pilus assembly ATPase PilB-like protein [Inhella inkyongensis]